MLNNIRINKYLDSSIHFNDWTDYDKTSDGFLSIIKTKLKNSFRNVHMKMECLEIYWLSTASSGQRGWHNLKQWIHTFDIKIMNIDSFASHLRVTTSYITYEIPLSFHTVIECSLLKERNEKSLNTSSLQFQDESEKKNKILLNCLQHRMEVLSCTDFS